jgi:SOUL heme-binding protein
VWPAFEVARQLEGGIEIRQYLPSVVAEVLVVDGSADEAGNRAFPTLVRGATTRPSHPGSCGAMRSGCSRLTKRRHFRPGVEPAGV